MDPILARALETKGRHAAVLRRYPNVTGVGVGFREVGGRSTDEVVLRVFVSRKLPLSELAKEDVLPRELDGLRVDVRQADMRAHTIPAEHQVRHALVHGGLSVGNQLLGGSGSIGSAVFDARSGQQLLLSNWHVLVGRTDSGHEGEPVLQPGTGGGDAGTPSDVVARVLRSSFTATVDAAVAVVSGHRHCTDELFGLGRVAHVPGVPSLGLHVLKTGRTTGVVQGRISDVAVDQRVRYDGLGTFDFEDQVHVESLDGTPVSLPGDSGSLWVDDGLRPVALNFAGDDAGTLATANPIDLVMLALDIRFGPGLPLQHRRP